jgi:hypothetical protein
VHTGDPDPLPGTARDIRIEIKHEGRSVEVRLTERAGDVRVAVRTPDTRLAGDLRQDLPALTSRLEQSGYRTAAWHPGESGRERQPGSPAASTENGSEGRQPDGRDAQQQQKGNERQARNDDAGRGPTKRKDFTWLLQSLR